VVLPHVRRTEIRSLATALLAAGIAATFSHPLLAQQVPPGVTPGAVLPHFTIVEPAPVSQSGELFTIPRVSERPLGRDEGPHLKVQAFVIKGVTDRPAHMHRRLATLGGGLATLGSRFGVAVSQWDINQTEVRQLLDAALKQEPPEGFTVNQLQELATKVADYYHSKGYILAQAFVPAQDVRDGLVTVQVLEGKLSGIAVEGNKTYSTRTLLRPFNSLVGGPVEKDSMESALLTLTNYPGVNAFGVLGAGRDVGTTLLTLRVQREQRVTLESSVDNHGSQFAGEYRGQLALGVNNLVGDADRLRLYGLYGFDPSDKNAHGAYGGVSYEIPLFSPRDFVLASYATNSYDIGKVTADIAATHPKGDTGIGELGYRHNLAPNRLGSSTFGLYFDVKRGTFKQLGQDRYKDNLTTAKANITLDRIDTRFRGVNQVELAYTRGFKNALGANGDYDAAAATPASRFGASGQFGKVTLTLQRLQKITTNSSIIFRIVGQQSSDPLVSLEQISLGGPDAVRAYAVADALADKGALGSAELVIGAPGFANHPAFANRTWGQVLQVSLFTDYGYGRMNTPLLTGATRNFNLGGAGGAIQLNVPNRVFARIDVSKKITSAIPGNGRNPQYFFRLGVSF